MASSDAPNAIIIGGGAAGICMAYQLKKIGFTDFTIYEKMSGLGGTWFANTYPGCGCDVPSQLYSFSFALNPNWSKPLCEQPEILAYMEKVVDDCGLRGYFQLQMECTGAVWLEKEAKWEVSFKNLVNDYEFTRKASIFISGVGGISTPKWITIPGQETFPGPQFHSARWDHNFDYNGKRLAVIGNGCSASQIVPQVVQKASYVKQYTRSPQWIHERPNKEYTPLMKAIYRYVPLYQRLERLWLFMSFDRLTVTYGAGEKAVKARVEAEKNAKQYVYDNSPQKYYKMLIPDFPLGCKRRVFDPDYLSSLWAKNLDVVESKIAKIDGNVIEETNGTRTEFDGICYATGFRVTDFLTPMTILGSDGQDLNDKWRESGGATAFKGTTVAGFPNFAILFGPNTFLAHNSAIFIIECGVQYVVDRIIKPLVNKEATSIVVKREAEDRWASHTQARLQKMVWSAGCTNWAVGSTGRNTASYPGTGHDLWLDYMSRDANDYQYRGVSQLGKLYRVTRWLRMSSLPKYALVIFVLGCMRASMTKGLAWAISDILGLLRSSFSRAGLR